jgi:EAL and modified HD-GYP domain-containing signal transduction protein
LDAKQRVVGYELSWQQQKSAPASTLADLELLVDFVAEQMVDEDNGGNWLLRDKILFLEAVPAMLSTDALHRLPPERTVLSLKAAALANPDTVAAVQALRAGGVGILLREADLARSGARLPTLASYVEVRFSGNRRWA